MFFTLFEEREGGTKGVPNSFPALIEGGFNHFGKEGLITVQSLDLIAGKPNNRTFYFGRRVEYAFMNRKQIFDVVKGL